VAPAPPFEHRERWGTPRWKSCDPLQSILRGDVGHPPLFAGPFLLLLGDGSTHPFAKNAEGWGTLRLLSQRGLYLTRRRPTLPHTCGAGALARETCPSARQHPSASIYIPMFTCHRQRSLSRLRCGLKAAGGGRPTQSVPQVYRPDTREVPIPQAAPACAEGGRGIICYLLRRRKDGYSGAGPRSGARTLFVTQPRKTGPSRM
jgi:hypothetical protein